MNGAAHPPFVSAPLRDMTLRYSVADLGPEYSDGTEVHEPELGEARKYEAIYEADGDWVERSLNVDPATRKEYRDGVRRLTVGATVTPATQIEPEFQPDQAQMELTRFGAAFLTDQEIRQNRGDDVTDSSVTVRGVRCAPGTNCVEVSYARERTIENVDSLMSVFRAGPNEEHATVVYDLETKRVYYYELSVNGQATHRFGLVRGSR